mgnify:CR=1 FL=1
MSELVQGRNITITAPLAESVLKNMVDLMPGSTLNEDDNAVTITSAQGVNLIDVAKELVLTPQDTTDYVLTIWNLYSTVVPFVSPVFLSMLRKEGNFMMTRTRSASSLSIETVT